MTAAPSLPEIAAAPWDVVVVGAGPAGSVAAATLAEAGLRTLLVDKKPFPRPKVCGGCLNPRAIAALEAVGLTPARTSGPVINIDSLELRAGHRRACVPLPGGLVVDRAEFDDWL